MTRPCENSQGLEKWRRGVWVRTDLGRSCPIREEGRGPRDEKMRNSLLFNRNVTKGRWLHRLEPAWAPSSGLHKPTIQLRACQSDTICAAIVLPLLAAQTGIESSHASLFPPNQLAHNPATNCPIEESLETDGLPTQPARRRRS